jgi:hypothetical protein
VAFNTGRLLRGQRSRICPRLSRPHRWRLRLGFWLRKLLCSLPPWGFVGIDMLAHRLMTAGQFVRNLFRSPLNTQIESHLRPDPRLYALGVATALASLLGLVAGLLSTAATLPTATGDFAADGAAVSAPQAGNLRECVLGFHEAVDLLPFFSAEVLVHRATSTWRFKAAIMSTHP